jgi:autotransporter family porin
MWRKKLRTGKELRYGRRCRALLTLAAMGVSGGRSLASVSTTGDTNIGNGNGNDVAYVANGSDSGSFTLIGQSWSNGTMSVANGSGADGQILIQSLASYNVSGALFLSQGDVADSTVTVDTNSALNTGTTEFLPDSDMYAVNGVISNAANGTASVTISNASSWTNDGGIGVGFLGNGSLNVQTGSSVTTSLLLVGNSGVGTMSVSGSMITVFPDFQIGAASYGSSVMLDQDSTLTAGTLAMSESAASGDSLLDIGNGSQVTISDGASVGRYGSATVNVHDNASFTSGNFFLAEQPDVTAAMNVTNSSTASFQQLNVAFGGTAALSVSGQSNIASTGAFIGVNEGSAGTVNLGQAAEESNEASDGGWANSGEIIVGDAGTGYVNINTSGSSVVTDTLILGGAVGGVGTMTMTGGNLTVNTIAYVGEFGTGTLNLNDGAVAYAVDMSVGSDVNPDGANGTVNVDGEKTFLTVSDTLLVGQGATVGQVDVDAGGVLTCNETNIGQDDDSTGTIKFTNGSFGALGNTYVGLNGGGALSIDESAVTATAMYIGYADTSVGMVELLGANGFLTISGDLYVGQSSDVGGSLTMSDGANLEAANIYIGENIGGTGTFTITGAADGENNPVGLATADGELSVGGSGTGIMQMSEGAQVTAGNTVVGRDPTGIGALTITGDSEGGPAPQLWAGDLIVGYQGNGNLSVTAGGLLTATSLTLGSMDGGVGVVRIDGTATVANVSGSATIGDQGDGTLTLSGGAALNNGDAFVAQSAGSVSSVLVTDDGSIWHSYGSLYIGGSAAGAGGDGLVTVDTGGSVVVDGTLQVWDTGQLVLNGGTVSSMMVDVDGGTLTFANGHLHVTAALMVSNGGRVNINAGDASVGGLSISGNGGVNVNGSLAINFGSAANDPVSGIVSYLRSSYAGGAWSGTAGIISTMAEAGGTGPILSVGYADGNRDMGTPAAANQVVIKLTLAGDANLDGNVNFNDLDIVGQHLNTSGNDWAEGNFNYDPNGAVNFNDLDIVGQNLNKTINTAGVEVGGTVVPIGETAQTVVSATAAVPEPGACAAILWVGAVVMARQRRGRSRRAATREPAESGDFH